MIPLRKGPDNVIYHGFEKDEDSSVNVCSLCAISVATVAT